MLSRKLVVLLILISGLIVFLDGCTVYKLQRQLDEYEQEEYQLLRFFGTRKEYVGYLKTPPEQRPDYIEDFWKMYDPDIVTRRNEFYMEVKRRYKFADKKYKELKTPGHLTARGRIYIMFGPPDDVIPTRYTPTADESDVNREYFAEIWVYSYPQTLEFMFVDELGIGSYSMMKYKPGSSNDRISKITPIPDVTKPPYRLRTMEEVKKLKAEGYFK